METPIKPQITFDDVMKLDVRIGQIVAAAVVEKSDELVLLQVDFGELGYKTVVSGLKSKFHVEELVNTSHPFVVNLPPRVFKKFGLTSEAMIVLSESPDKAYHQIGQDSNIIGNIVF